jgi:type II secretory pathway component GspD/PulD (secretin)
LAGNAAGPPMPRRVFTGLVFVAALMSVGPGLVGPALVGPALAADLPLPPGPYKYLVIDQDVKGVLTEFGRNVGVPVDVSDQVKGRLRGQISTATAREFLDGLCESYGLVWYFDGTALHISAKTEVRTELISIGRLPPGEATSKLSALGVSDARFPVRTTEDAGFVSVSGPPPFLSLARKTLIALASRIAPPAPEDSGSEVRVRVFRGGLTPAPADEVVVSRARTRG